MIYGIDSVHGIIVCTWLLFFLTMSDLGRLAKHHSHQSSCSSTTATTPPSFTTTTPFLRDVADASRHRIPFLKPLPPPQSLTTAQVRPAITSAGSVRCQLRVCKIDPDPIGAINAGIDMVSVHIKNTTYIYINMSIRSTKCVVVLISSRPLVVEPYLSSMDALMAAWLRTEGQGVNNVLFGDYGFTGKLPRTWFKTEINYQ
ncbi:hypothetical protein BUALT_Bualt11G0099200 [Buddleja alternifolia]|uniref:beta-glucosidase n=1 Tax=Buddleja alternifolia TaxID=168488 RepID=A0AAV6WV92_9LAMI|nr:hypothetical protein BUALT_Bualt11G0099200 [Buddleja alternifolia]